MSRISKKKIKEALHEKRGIISEAAKYIGCSRMTIYNYMEKYPDVKEAHKEAKEEAIDYVEGRLFKQIEKGNMTGIIFYLKTQGKERGYVERQEFEPVGEITFRVIEDSGRKDPGGTPETT
jgi:hypothetical protein